MRIETARERGSCAGMRRCAGALLLRGGSAGAHRIVVGAGCEGLSDNANHPADIYAVHARNISRSPRGSARLPALRRIRPRFRGGGKASRRIYDAGGAFGLRLHAEKQVNAQRNAE